MMVTKGLGLILAAWLAQDSAAVVDPHVSEGDRVAVVFRAYRGDLDRFQSELRSVLVEHAPALLPELDREDPPPEPGIYGYQMLPAIVEEAPPERRERIETFSYSWPITRGYIETEIRKLEAARPRLHDLAGSVPESETALGELIREYRTLVDNLETIDQYLQYNRFWQRAIAVDRARFDRLTEYYDILVSDDAERGAAIREYLGQPNVPSHVEIEAEGAQTRMRLRVYTDILDTAYLETIESGVEGMWRVDSSGHRYELDVEFFPTPPGTLYAPGEAPSPGDHLDLARHAARFPDDGALLTTGAESTYGYIGDYVALGPGDITIRTLAHEFGHVLGFADGYIRGYRDLGAEGFEILELTSAFDDIMSAPREGQVLASHFELMLGRLEE